jgi:hypothetical protein
VTFVGHEQLGHARAFHRQQELVDVEEGEPAGLASREPDRVHIDAPLHLHEQPAAAAAEDDEPALDVGMKKGGGRLRRSVVAHHVKALDADQVVVLEPLAQVAQLVLEHAAGREVDHVPPGGLGPHATCRIEPASDGAAAPPLR